MSSIVRKVVNGPIFLLLVPFTLHMVGVAGYGTWAILLTIIRFSGLLDPGLTPAVTKYTAEHCGRGDAAQIRQVLDTACAICLCLAAIAAGIVWLGEHAIIGQLFRGPDASHAAEVMSMWPLLVATIVVSMLSAPFISVINGHQRLDLTNGLVLSADLVSVLFTVILLLAGEKVRGLLLAQFLSSSFVLVGSIAIVRYLLPSFTPNPLRSRITTAKSLGLFSIGLYAGYIMTVVQSQLEKLYLARFVGVVSVGWYSMASDAAAKVQRVPGLLMEPVLAAASELDATNERRKLNELHFRANKYLALTLVPLVVFSVLCAKTLVTVWVGYRLALIAFPFAALVIGNFFPQAGLPTYLILVGRGIIRPAITTAIFATVLNVVLSLIFIARWGFSGAVFGVVLSMFISTVYWFVVCNPYFDGTLFHVLRRAYFKPLVCALAAGCLIPVISALDLHAWPGLALKVVVFATIYCAGILVTRFFDSFDFTKAEGHLPFLRLARRIARA
jgi:O-antigen/teichoic acid export membrane protein